MMHAIYVKTNHMQTICEVIKQNDSELANIDFEMKQITAFIFLCMLLFWAALKRLHLWNHKVVFMRFSAEYSSKPDSYNII